MTGRTRVRVAVIGGGQSCEHDVSLASAASVADALDPSLHDVVHITIGRDGSWHVSGRDVGLSGAVDVLRGCDAVFPVVHGPLGEDGALAALCELARVPYVGSAIGPGALAMDKRATKLVAEAVGVATAPGRLVDATSARGLAWSGPVVVKPVAAGSSHGVSLVRSADGLGPALAAALALDDRALVEDVVVGREVDVAVLRRADGALVTSPALEIVVDGLFDHDAKYGGTAVFHVPALLDPADADALDAAARSVYTALGCSGVARVDFFLTEDGPVLNEVNTMPGMTEHSQVPRMFAAAGLSYPDLLADLVRGAGTKVPVHAPTPV